MGRRYSEVKQRGRESEKKAGEQWWNRRRDGSTVYVCYYIGEDSTVSVVV